MGNEVGSALNFVLFYSYLFLNIKVDKKIFLGAIIKGETIVTLILRLSRIDFSLY
jgi:hypothetical protein